MRPAGFHALNGPCAFECRNTAPRPALILARGRWRFAVSATQAVCRSRTASADGPARPSSRSALRNGPHVTAFALFCSSWACCCEGTGLTPDARHRDAGSTYASTRFQDCEQYGLRVLLHSALVGYSDCGRDRERRKAEQILIPRLRIRDGPPGSLMMPCPIRPLWSRSPFARLAALPSLRCRWRARPPP